MDAKTLRAALSAAIRVSVSTSLIGCGGSVTSTDAGDAPVSGGASPSRSQPELESKYPKPTSSGGKSAEEPYVTLPTGGVATGGASAANGGAPLTEGGSAGEPALDQCSPVEACMTVLETVQVPWDQPLPSAARACCEMLVSELKPIEPPSGEGQWGISECGARIETRFEHTSVTMKCCQETGFPPIRSLACTPWGPPVPPELPLAALEAWELAA
jgi:hypothetical protein